MINIISKIVVCPKCKSSIKFRDENLKCENCLMNFSFDKENNIISMLIENNDLVELYDSIFQNEDPYHANDLTPIMRIGHEVKVNLVDEMITEELSDYIGVDIGCADRGFGGIAKKFKNLKYGIGMDISKIGIKKTILTKQQNIIYINIDASFPFKDNSIDIIFAGEILEHTKNPVDFIEDAWRVLKNNGVIIFTVPNKSPLLYRVFFHHYSINEQHISICDYKTYKKLILKKFIIEKEAGFNQSFFAQAAYDMDRNILNLNLVKYWSEIFINYPRFATGIIFKCKKVSN